MQQAQKELLSVDETTKCIVTARILSSGRGYESTLVDSSRRTRNLVHYSQLAENWLDVALLVAGLVTSSTTDGANS